MAGKNAVKTKQRTQSTGTRSFVTEDSRTKEIAKVERERRQSQISMASEQNASSDEESEDEQLDSDYDIEDDKDEAELELEKLVFGDSKGFMENIHAFGKEQEEDTLMREGSEVGSDGEDGLAGLRDQDLFISDFTGSGAAPLGFAQDDAADSSDEEVSTSRQKAAWEDSDDERISVSLAAVPRLRKLRVDAEDDIVNGKDYIRRLRKQFLLLNPTPDWVVEARQQRPSKRRRLSQDSDDSEVASDEDDNETPATKPLADLLRNVSGLVRSGVSTKGRKIRPETINIQRVNDIGTTQPSAVDSISFHPTLPLLLSSGPSGTLYLHHIVPSPPAPEPNPLLTSLHLRKTALSTSAFHPTDSRIFLSARRRYFHVWDVASGKVEKITRIYGQQHEQKSMEVLKPSPCGRFIALKGSSKKGGGLINILDADTLQWRCQLRIDSGHGVADFAWWRTGDGLTAAGMNGEITEWSVISETVTGRWSDAGAVGTTVLALGGRLGVEGSKAAPIGNDRWIAIGSSSGVVNIYDRGEWYKNWSAAKSDSPCPKMPEPTKVLDHLVTATSTIAFSPDAQLLAIASKAKKDALRLVHLPSCTVYKNWPTAATPLGRVTGIAFGAGKGKGEEDLLRMVVGNDAGKVRMWEIRP